VKIALAQINPIVGDLAGNSRKIIDFARRALDRGAELAVFPELCVTGYPPLDLLENDSFIVATQRAVDEIVASVPRALGVLIGVPIMNASPRGKRLLNAARLYEGGRLIASVSKMLLPTYDVFDEYRYFEPATEQKIIDWRGIRLGVHICEDMWNNEEQANYHLYERDPVAELAQQGADIFINISASPFTAGKHQLRNNVVEEICRKHHLPFVLVNQVGANTEVIFDGDSRVHDAAGRLVACAPSFVETLVIWDSTGEVESCSVPTSRVGQLHDALVLGIRDYFEKTGAFTRVTLGLSGGIDSAVTCALAAAAVGSERVVGVTMPSIYSSKGSVNDSKTLAENLGIEFMEIPIRPAVDAFAEMLEPAFATTEPGLAEENLQSRVRGVTLMALSNKFGYLLLATGNKSELATGYATLYGDTNGGLAVLADVFKGDVYALAEYINKRAGREIIPSSTIHKPPSAELRPDQKDTDSLPPYPILDEVLRRYIEKKEEFETIAASTGIDRNLIYDILHRVDYNEYKRRQTPPGLRVSAKAFGSGRRLPIVMRWDRQPEPDAA
jgi:NAD+ synthase (glutamine-hydrolysing)